MKCTFEGCLGAYEQRRVLHTLRHRGDVVVIDHVPADVCSSCGDVLMGPDTIRRIEVLLDGRRPPTASVSLYEFA